MPCRRYGKRARYALHGASDVHAVDAHGLEVISIVGWIDSQSNDFLATEGDSERVLCAIERYRAIGRGFGGNAFLRRLPENLHVDARGWMQHEGRSQSERSHAYKHRIRQFWAHPASTLTDLMPM